MSNKPNESLINLSYEELSVKLKTIIEDFQKGNMQLGDAVEKYNLCIELIKLCQEKIDKLNNIAQEEQDLQNIDIKNIPFEENMQQLTQMHNVLNEPNVAYDKIVNIMSSSKQLIAQCRYVLDHSEHIIEYKN